MQALVVLAHPKPGSFNHALADAACRELAGLGYRVSLRDLYAEGFDPLLADAELGRGHIPPEHIREHANLVLAADAIVVVHPNWWSQALTILKGWLDRVLRTGEAYRFATDANGQGVIVGLLKARGALIFTTANTPQRRGTLRRSARQLLEALRVGLLRREAGSATQFHAGDRQHAGDPCVLARRGCGNGAQAVRQIVPRANSAIAILARRSGARIRLEEPGTGLG